MMGEKNLSFGGEALYEIQAIGSSVVIPNDLLGGMNLELTQISENKHKYTLSGMLRDQAELAGVLNTIYEMHMVVLSVNRLDADQDKSKT